MLLSLLYQLDQTQWLSAEALFAEQARQLQLLFGHAAATVPFYNRRFAEAGVDPAAVVTRETLNRLPILRRSELQGAGDDINTTALPKSHGKTHEVETSGSTGRSVRLNGTEVTSVFWRACVMREHLWQGRDLGGKLAAIRWARKGIAMPPEGAHGESWGPASGAIYPTGPAVLLNIMSELPEQVAWIHKEAPDYLISFPSNLVALAKHCIERDIRFESLKQVMAVGETVTDQARKLVREAWGIPIKDSYSCEEAGYLTIQCPDHDVYHVQSESVFVEVVDDEGKACSPGEGGRVLITSLHNFATPLIRYELGDYAEVGAPCACGRGLPVITRTLGRQRNRLILPDGSSVFPYLGDHGDYQAITSVVQRFQFIQRSLNEIEKLMVVSAPVTPKQEEHMRALIVRNLGHPFNVTFTYVDEIPLSPRGKYEEFVSEVTG
ncbi:phenylacetate--CoA ligase family protein [Pelagibius litoralis]|uniref:Phenylacetate--CoA ligase family protein n=1 Tax=Pelagibius litoralis TaxID=374515 RepID=A0A967C912_9PROT|nr:phenylacetate--CoA ligase family protein [Pelagibius litoralis]NIA68782.1 phenylacetate--CoA ligase family protein [Pelagibius litoralis]